MSSKNIKKLAEQIQSGDTRSIARGISLIEQKESGAVDLLDQIYPGVGRANRIGITGPPGSGKSSLITALTEQFIEDETPVGIVAVDPSSPFSGGALLGDRVRMSSVRHPLVFIRSMANRGRTGGLAPSTLQVCDLLDASGKHQLLVETVGVGQSEVEISGLVDTTLLVLTPGSGDSIQAMKAGLMEIGDIIVINKKDRGGADRVEQELRSILSMRDARTAEDAETTGEVEPTIIQTSAREREQIDELYDLIVQETTGDAETERNERKTNMITNQITLVLERAIQEEVSSNPSILELKSNAIDQVQSGQMSPYRAVQNLLERIGLDTSISIPTSSFDEHASGELKTNE